MGITFRLAAAGRGGQLICHRAALTVLAEMFGRLEIRKRTKAIAQRGKFPLSAATYPVARLDDSQLTDPEARAHGASMEKTSLATNIGLVAGFSLVALGGLWWLHIHSYSVVSAIEGVIRVVRAAGPLAYFTAMAFLPAIGCPLVAFYLPAAAAFSDQMGMVGVLLAAGLAILVNLTFSYWLAYAALRPWFERLVSKTRYSIPTITDQKAAEITFLVRVVQGPPFFMQSYLLALAQVRFSTYLWVSWVVAMIYATGYIVFGEAILSGEVKYVLMGISILAAIALLAQIIRRRYAR